MGTKLYILVENFSNSERESFFEQELPYLVTAFDEVVVIPLYPDETKLSFYAPNLRVEDFDFFKSSNRINTLLNNLFTIIRIFWFEIIHTHNRVFYLKNFVSNLNQLLFKLAAATNLEKLIRKDIHSKTVFYSYWFMQWFMALSIIKLKHPKMIIVSRVHGADYDENQIKSTLPFRYFQLAQINRIFPVSVFAKTYLQSKFKVESKKIDVSRLGIQSLKYLSPINESELHIVSCSSIISLKRVDLIVEILKHISIYVKWTHFGDGQLAEDVKRKALQLGNHVSVNFMGYVSNDIFLNYLKNHSVSFFINVSESEGLPVSMMEAISHGIPLIGTDICGVPEIVVKETGFLFPVNFDPKKIAEKIMFEHEKGSIYAESFRNNIYEFYLKNFKADTNHEKFSIKILSLCAE